MKSLPRIITTGTRIWITCKAHRSLTSSMPFPLQSLKRKLISANFSSPQGEIPEEAMRRKKGTGVKGDKEKTLDGVESDDDDKPVREED